MKHTWSVTLMLVGLFVIAQLIGLGIIAAGSNQTMNEDGSFSVAFDDTALGPRPVMSGFEGFTYIIIGIAIGTGVLLLLIKFNLLAVWKLWFFLAVFLALTIALGTLLPFAYALALAFALASWKIWRPNFIIHNITEVLIYSGITWLIVPNIPLGYVAILLLVIAVYDAYAVWRSKHMVAMAQFQTDSKLFAGLSIPYTMVSVAPKSAKNVKLKTTKVKMGKDVALGVKPVARAMEGRNAILGGGDIAFPLFFTGATLISLLGKGFSVGAAYGYSLIVVVGATIALTGLFLAAKKDRFYPAMPFIAAGCFVGYGVLWLVAL